MAKSHDEIRNYLRSTLDIDSDQIAFTADESTGIERVAIVLRDSQIDWAVRDNGRFVRQAARELGIEIELSGEHTE